MDDMQTMVTDAGSEIADGAPRDVAFSREKVMAIQEVIADLPQVELPTLHHFSKIGCPHPTKVYLRQVFHPAGVAVVGFEHLDEHLFILAVGHLTITTDDGDMDIRGPCVMNTKPGMKRVAYAHEDSIIMTIHATDLDDPDAIMDSILKPEPGSPYRAAFGGGAL